MLIGSISTSTGKTLLIAYLIGEAINRKMKVAYLKVMATPYEKSDDEDVISLRQLFPEIECKSGMVSYPHKEEKYLSEESSESFKNQVKEEYEALKKKFDRVFLEAPQGIFRGASFGIDIVSLTEDIGEKVLIIERADESYIEDRIMCAKNIFGENLSGVVINRIPNERMKIVEQTGVPFLKKKGVNILGLLPLEKGLFGVRIRELMDALKGQCIVGKEYVDVLVNGVHIGSLPHDRALSRYRRNPDWVVVVSGTRTESIAAAVEAGVKGIIATGGVEPSGAVVAKAESKGIPIVKVNDETMKISGIIDKIMSKSSILKEKNFHEVEKFFKGKINVDAILG